MCGGVSSIWNSLGNAFGVSARYVIVGRRTGESGAWKQARRLLLDIIEWRRAVAQSPAPVIVNTSVQPLALLRDSVLLVLAKSAGRRIVVFVHGWDAGTFSRIESSPVLRRLFRSTFLTGTGIIVLADTFREALLNIDPAAHVHRGSIVVASEWFEPLSPQRPSPPKLLFMSRLEEAKGLRDVLTALSILRDKGTEPELLVLGKGPAEASSRQYCEELGLRNVKFCGLIQGEEQRRLVDSTSIFLLPTHYGEGLPVVVGEAMARGLAVITTATGGLADVFEDGLMGALVPPRTPGTLAAAIERHYTDVNLLRSVSAYNRAAAKRLFAAEPVARMINRLCASGR
jgi:glycosyltransferase involved in cell wall biosynthesis